MLLLSKARFEGVEQMRSWGLRPRRFRPRYAGGKPGAPVLFLMGCYDTGYVGTAGNWLARAHRLMTVVFDVLAEGLELGFF